MNCTVCPFDARSQSYLPFASSSVSFLYLADQSRLRHYAQYFWSALFTQNAFSSCLLPELSSRRDPFLLPFFFLFLFFGKMLQLIKTVISESQ